MTKNDYEVCAEICAHLLRKTEGRIRTQVILEAFTSFLGGHRNFDVIKFTIRVSRLLETSDTTQGDKDGI